MALALAAAGGEGQGRARAGGRAVASPCSSAGAGAWGGGRWRGGPGLSDLLRPHGEEDEDQEEDEEEEGDEALAQEQRELRERRLRAWARATAAERRRERLEQEQQQQRLSESLAQWPNEHGQRHREPGLRRQRLAQEQEAGRRDTLDRAKRLAQPKKRQVDKKRLGEREAREPSGPRLQDRMARALEKKLLKDAERSRRAPALHRCHEQVDHQVQAEELYRRLAIEQRLQRSQEILDQLMEERNEELKGKSLGEEEQGPAAQLRAKETEEEKKRRKSMLLKIAEMKIQQARDMLAQNAEHKAQRSKEVNGVKERGHRFQRCRLDEEDNSYPRDTQETIRRKDQKSRRMSRDKEATLEEARKRAGASYGL